jgi:putative spermidine/putrescine transport system ATP-binding protein
MNELRVSGLRKQIGEFVLEADFTVKEGDRIAVCAPSGAGKTSLLRLIAGLESLSDGSILIDGRDVTTVPVERREIGYVFQEPTFLPRLDLVDNITFALLLRGIGRAEREMKVKPWLERFRLLAGADVRKMSGGEKQRAALLRAVIWRPRVLLLDEPFSALDPELRESICKDFLALHAEWPVPTLIVTHDARDEGLVATGRLSFQDKQTNRVFS